MTNEVEIAELRYEETIKAINIWLGGQKGKGSRAEAIGVAKAFLKQASMAIAISTPGCGESDSRRLMKGFVEVVTRFMDDKRETHHD